MRFARIPILTKILLLAALTSSAMLFAGWTGVAEATFIANEACVGGSVCAENPEKPWEEICKEGDPEQGCDSGPFCIDPDGCCECSPGGEPT